MNTNGTTTYWSNNGSSSGGSEPSAAVTLTVTKGLYFVLLGDTSIANMTVAVPSSVFTNSDVRLRVWFNDGTHGSQLLTPDQRIAAVGYTFMADNIKDGAITTAKIATGAVGTASIANGAVGSTQLGSGLTLAGTTTGTFSGSLNGNASTATSATNFSGSLAGNVTGTQGATVVASVGGVTAANVASGANLANAATNSNFSNTIVKRDASGNFNANIITANGSALSNLNASNLTIGQVPLTQLPATVALETGGNSFTGFQTLTGDFGVGKTQAAGAGNSSFLEFNDSTGGFRGLYGVDGLGYSGATNQFTIGTWSNHPLAFYTNQARRMTILSNGNVGIGTATPAVGLDVVGAVNINGRVGIGAPGAPHATLEIGINNGSYTASGATGFSHYQHSFLVDIPDGTYFSAVYANGDVVVTNGFIANSDERIKNIIGRSDAARDLSTTAEYQDQRWLTALQHSAMWYATLEVRPFKLELR